MANFTINYQANTTGNHIIGYRTYNDPINTYTVVTQNLLTTGPQSVNIDVDGNLYCGAITYECYVVAGCKLNDEAVLIATGVPDISDDAGGDGFPDLAVGITVNLLKQDDPCTYATVTCDNTPIDSITIDDDGTSLCDDGTYPLVFTEVTPGDELVAADADVTVSGNIVTGVVINNSGSYKAAPTISVTIPNCTSAPAFTAVMEACPIIDLTDYQCQNDDAGTPPLYALELGESFGYCIDINNLPTAVNYSVVASDYCHCRECESYTVTNNTGSSSIITVQQCWDSGATNFQTTTFIIPDGQSIPTGCAVAGTLVLGDPALTVVINPC